MKQAVIIAGSPVKTSRLTGVLQYVEQALIRQRFSVHWIHVSDLPAEHLIKARFDSPAVAEANSLVEKADVLIVASPVYKASYTGVLKTFLDLLPQKGLAGKAVLPVFIGGTIAHLLSIDYSLKPVLSVLGATRQSGGVYALDTQVIKTENGGYELDSELTRRLEQAVQDLAAEAVS